MLVLRLLRHRERSRHGHLDRPVGVRAQEAHVVRLHGVGAVHRSDHRSDHPRHRVGVAAAVERLAGVVDVDAVERRREVLRVALPALLTVGDDVEAGPGR